jgi:methylase of polypeptide subunit release factors
MYDGKDIDEAEMNEWLDDTIETILNCKHPLNVLEVGMGSEMILFNLGSELNGYCGIDVSRKAVQYVTNTAKSIAELAGKVHMFNGAATDVKLIYLPL